MKGKAIVFMLMLLVIILRVGVFAVKSFFIGNTIRPDAIGVVKIDVNDSQIQFSGDFVLESSKAFKNYSYRIDGDIMYIKIHGVLVSARYNSGHFDIVLDGDFSTIRAVYLEDDNDKQLIWGK